MRTTDDAMGPARPLGNVERGFLDRSWPRIRVSFKLPRQKPALKIHPEKAAIDVEEKALLLLDETQVNMVD